MSWLFSQLLAFWLVLQCGSSDYHVREEATKSLKGMADDARVARVVLMGAVSKDPETARRCRLVLRLCEPLIRPTAANYYPCLSSFKVRVEPYFELMERLVIQTRHYRERGLSREEARRRGDFLSRWATPDYIPSLLKAGYTKKQIVDMMDEAIREERKSKNFAPGVGPNGWW